MSRRWSERRLWLLPGLLLCHMLVCMVMVMMDVELRQSSWVYMVVREMVLCHGEPQRVVEEVMVMELLVVMAPKRRGAEASKIGAHPVPHALASPPPAASGAARAALPRAARDRRADVGVVG